MKYIFAIATILLTLNIHAQDVSFDADFSVVVETEPEPEPGSLIFSEDGKYGIKDVDGSILLPAIYHRISENITGIFVLNQGGNHGLFTMKSKTIVLPVEYSSISIDNARGIFDNNITDKFVVCVSKGKLYGLLDHNFQTIFPVEYKMILSSKEYVHLRNQQDKVGIWFFDESCQDIPLVFDHVNPVVYTISKSSTNCFIAKQKDNYFLFSGKGREVISNALKAEMAPDVWNGYLYSDHVFFVDQNNKCGIYNYNNDIITVPAIYDDMPAFFENIIIASKAGKYGIINSSNNILVPFLYDALYFSRPNETDFVIVAKKEKMGLIDIKNNVLIPFKYDEIENLNNQRYKVCVNGKCYMCDKTGKVLAKQAYEHIGVQYDGKSAVFNKGMIGYIDDNGKIIEPVHRKIEARGYKTAQALFENFVAVLKSENDSLLMDFTKDLRPDNYSKEFMSRIDYSYRGFPSDVSKENMDKAIEECYKVLKSFRDSLKERKELQNLEFSGLDQSPDGYFKKELNLLGKELRGILKTKTDTYEFNFGALINVDGFWKSFARPSVANKTFTPR